MTKDSGADPALAKAEPASRLGPSGFDPGEAKLWPFRITDFAPSHRQFRLSESLTEEEVTKAVGFGPKRTPDGDKVTLCWQFWAELTYILPNGKHGSTSTCCKIWDYNEERWSAYGWPEVFEQIGLTPLFIKDYGDWQFKEDGNPTVEILRAGLATLARIEAGTDETPKDQPMTINKEQPVSDAMREAGEDQLSWYDGENGSAVVESIYLAMKAASHPLEQQQAKEGTLAEQLREHSRRLSYAEDTHHDDVVSMCKEARPYIDKAADALDQQAVSGDVVERVAGALSKQMENEEAQSLPSSMQRERGLIWLEGWFDLRTALQEEGVERRD